MSMYDGVDPGQILKNLSILESLPFRKPQGRVGKETSPQRGEVEGGKPCKYPFLISDCGGGPLVNVTRFVRFIQSSNKVNYRVVDNKSRSKMFTPLSSKVSDSWNGFMGIHP